MSLLADSSPPTRSTEQPPITTTQDETHSHRSSQLNEKSGSSDNELLAREPMDEKNRQLDVPDSPNGHVDCSKNEVEDAVFEKRTMRKVDWRMLPLLGLLYSISLIDRTNVGLARTAGMGDDLGLNIGSRYNICLVVYFIPYILLQLPGNLLLRTLGVRVWIAICITGWGAAQLGMGFVKTWGELAVCRALLGLFEAGYFPAMSFVITTWYKRHEVHTRLAVFYLSSVVVSSFSPILAYGLSLLNGRGGLAGWSWIFIIEGIITLFLGILAFLYVPDFPDQNTFLTPEQTALVLRRVEEDRGDSVPDEMTARKVVRHVGDWTIWAYGLMFMSSTMPAYAIAIFTPQILRAMGFTVRDSLLLSAPPWAWAAIQAGLISHWSDKLRLRAPFIVLQALCTMVGLLMTLYAGGNPARYAGLFLAIAGSAGNITSVLAYSANNIVSQSKRAVSTAIVVAFGGVGGIFATTAFRERDYPEYIPGMWATIGCQLLMITLAGVLTLVYWRRNRAADRVVAVWLEGQEGFRYTL